MSRPGQRYRDINDCDDGKDHDPSHFLEVESQLEMGPHEPVVQPWPIDSGPS